LILTHSGVARTTVGGCFVNPFGVMRC